MEPELEEPTKEVNPESRKLHELEKLLIRFTDTGKELAIRFPDLSALERFLIWFCYADGAQLFLAFEEAFPPDKALFKTLEFGYEMALEAYGYDPAVHGSTRMLIAKHKVDRKEERS